MCALCTIANKAIYHQRVWTQRAESSLPTPEGRDVFFPIVTHHYFLIFKVGLYEMATKIVKCRENWKGREVLLGSSAPEAR
jgi:hypothetical protein